MIASHDWDLLVLGGGPAGTAAAIHGATKGLRVGLLERSPFPRDRPGESLHPGVEPIFELLGVKKRVEQAGFLRTTGIHRIENGSQEFHPFGGDGTEIWHGYQAWRADFDDILLREAKRRGVEVLQPIDATGVFRSDDRVAGITTRTSVHRAHYLIDASGRSRWLSRQLGLPCAAQSPRLIAWYGYLDPTSTGSEWQEPTFEISANEWCWSCLVKPSLVHWTRLSLRDTNRNRRAPERLIHLPVVRKPRGVDVTWRIASCTAGPGFFLVGDAASVLDPAASHGVLKALVTGIKAADAIATILRGDSDESTAVLGYDRWLQAWHRDETIRLEGVYRRLEPSLDWLGRAA